MIQITIMVVIMIIMIRLTAKVMLEEVLFPIAHLRGGSGAPDAKTSYDFFAQPIEINSIVIEMFFAIFHLNIIY